MLFLYLIFFVQISFSQENFCSSYKNHILESCGYNKKVSLRGYSNEHYAKDMRGVVLEKSYLSKNKINGIDFSFSNNKQIRIFSSWMMTCKFDKSVFIGSSIKKSDFSGSSFVGANFSGAKIENSSFKNCDFRGATFDHALLMFLDLRGANVEGVDFSKATLLSVRFQ